MTWGRMAGDAWPSVRADLAQLNGARQTHRGPVPRDHGQRVGASRAEGEAIAVCLSAANERRY